MDKEIYDKAVKCQKSWNRSQRLITFLTKKPIPSNINYCKSVPYSDGDKEVMNIFFQKNTAKKKPVFIYIHGGGWLSGEIDMRNSYVCEFAKLGFFAVSVDYTLSPQAVYPTQIRQCFKAVDYLYDNSDKYNIDMNNVLIGGESAGVHFVMHMVSCCKDHNLYEHLKIDFNHKNEFDIKAIISHSAAVSIEKFCDKNNKLSQIPNMDIQMEGYFGKSSSEISHWINTDKGKYATPRVTEKFPPIFFEWANKDAYRFDTLDLIKDALHCNVNYEEYEGTGILSNHAFSVIMCFKASKKCLEKTLDFILPIFKDYFYKTDKWKMRD